MRSGKSLGSGLLQKGLRSALGAETAELVLGAQRKRAPALSFEGEALRWSLEGRTLEVALHRAPVNEIGSAALRELEELVRLIEAGAGGARALLFYSTRKKGFSAGADLRALHEAIARHHKARAPKAVTSFALRRFIDRIHRTFDALDTAPLTTVAAVHGFCFGGGFELALTSDLIIADRSARFCFPELRLGLVPGFGGVPRLRRDLGNALVRDLLLTGRSLSAKRAHEVGLVSQVTARGEALSVARRVCEQAARFDGATSRAAKAFVKPIPREALDEEKRLFVELFASPTVERALHRFVTDASAHPYLPEAP